MLQLLGGVEALFASDCQPQGGAPPVVALARGHGHDLVSQRLKRMLSNLDKDPALKSGPAVSVLLGAAADIKLRLDKYMCKPFNLCELCKEFNPAGYVNECYAFLHADVDSLDVGFSMPLRSMALATGGENQQIKWLASPAVQDMLVSTCKRMFMNSLQAERLAAEAKHWVGRKITRVGTISRELVCARYHKERLARVRKLAEAERMLNAAKTTSRGSMAWLLSSDGDGVNSVRSIGEWSQLSATGGAAATHAAATRAAGNVAATGAAGGSENIRKKMKQYIYAIMLPRSSQSALGG